MVPAPTFAVRFFLHRSADKANLLSPGRVAYTDQALILSRTAIPFGIELNPELMSKAPLR